MYLPAPRCKLLIIVRISLDLYLTIKCLIYFEMFEMIIALKCSCDD